MRISDWSSDVCSSDLTEQPDIAVEALDGVILNIARAAMHLHGAVGDAADHLGGEILAAGGLHRDILAGAVAPRRVADHAARRVCFRAAVGQHRSEEHTSELQSLMRISYAVFCLKKK